MRRIGARLLGLLLVCGLAIASPRPVHAAGAMPLSDLVGSLISRSDRVVVGEVVNTSLEVGPQGFQTVAMVIVEETLAGYRSAAAEVRVSGGRIDGLLQHTPGAIDLEVGDMLLLFLSGDRITGVAEGAFYLEGSRAARNQVALWELGVNRVERRDWSQRRLRAAIETQQRAVILR